MWNAVGKFSFLIVAGLLLTGCTSVKPVLKIGLVAPFEGRHRAIGYDAIYSARLAIREINAKGGIGGYRVALVALDDRGDPELGQQAAATLAVDPGVVIAIGHFLPDTTNGSQLVYEDHDLPLIATDRPPFLETDPAELPADFLDRYAAITPFDEIAGPFAGPTYDAFGLVWQAFSVAENKHGTISRESVREALAGLEYEGLTGTVYLP